MNLSVAMVDESSSIEQVYRYQRQGQYVAASRNIGCFGTGE